MYVRARVSKVTIDLWQLSIDTDYIVQCLAWHGMTQLSKAEQSGVRVCTNELAAAHTGDGAAESRLVLDLKFQFDFQLFGEEITFRIINTI